MGGGSGGPAYGRPGIDAPGLAGQLIQPSTGDRKNKTGLPDRLKAGIETLSGLSMDDVRVRYNSPKPAQLHALAYAQGTEIHVGPGQERHLPHEAWHVVQQMQGRVKPTVQVNGLAVNDERGLEREANVMGTKALEIYRPIQAPSGPSNQVSTVEQQKEPTELFEDSSAAIGASREKVNLNFLSAPPIIQRNIVNDHLHEVQTFLNLQDSYQARVFDQIYHSYIGKTRHSPVAEQMASGLKVWAANYYNKSHAYLYEAKKADDFTRYPQYAILGVDTDKNPDLEVINLFFRYQQRYIGSSRSIEFKTTTSNHDVEKRDEEKGGKTVFDTRFDRHILTVDNSTAGENYYPFTDREISTRYGFLRNQDPKQFQWLYNQRLKKKISHYISRKTFSAPVEVRLEYRGKRYAYYSTDDR
ncbi:DUF4157 domain-containing protein [Chloroflexi bacterium TSY]|nr:DUF4157 domain-containing protein [Chloroflexi bacterium TSY]